MSLKDPYFLLALIDQYLRQNMNLKGLRCSVELLSTTTTTHNLRGSPLWTFVALLQCLRPHVTATTLRQFSRIVVAMLVMTGRVTMLGLSRWAGKGGSYRTVQRFFATVIPWAMLFWVFFRQHVYSSRGGLPGGGR